MKELNLYKLHSICNSIIKAERELDEQNTYVNLLGNNSNYCEMSFDEFLKYYSFRFEDDSIAIFNEDRIPWEDYSNDDISYIPSVLLSFSPEKLKGWIQNEVEIQLRAQETRKIADKEELKRKIESLTKQLEEY